MQFGRYKRECFDFNVAMIKKQESEFIKKAWKLVFQAFFVPVRR